MKLKTCDACRVLRSSCPNYGKGGELVKCEKCQTRFARYSVEGIIPNYFALCALCAAELCTKYGDTIGAEKFTAEAVSA